MRVKDVMSRDVEVVHPEDTLEDAAAKMAALNVGPLPVGAGDEVVGILTDRDIVVRAIADGRGPDEQVDTICTTDVKTLTPDQSVEDAIEIVRSSNVRRVPVVQDGRPVGILSIGDLAIERDEHSALADISAAPPNN